MKEIRSQKQLEIALSKLASFENPKVSEEQYLTPSSIAAEVLWSAYMKEDIEGKKIADLGAGTGVLGIGCLLLGATHVSFVEKDADAISILKKNLAMIESECEGSYEIIEGDINSVSDQADLVIMNPPFGTKQKHADKEFLLKALSLAPVTYSYHKTSTKDYIVQLAQKQGFSLQECFNFSYLLGNTMKHHQKRKQYIQVSCLVFTKS